MVLLITLECAVLLFGVLIFRADFFNPAVVSCAVFIIATVLCCFYTTLWLVTIKWKTTLVIGISLVIMIVGTLFGRVLAASWAKYKRKASHQNQSKYLANANSSIRIPANILVFLSATVLLLTLLYGVSAYKLGTSYGGAGLNAFGYLKDAYSNGTATVRMNIFVRQGYKFVLACAYIACLLLSDELVRRQGKPRVVLIYLGWIICGALITIMSGSRTDILRLFSAFVVDYIMIYSFVVRSRPVEERPNLKSVMHYVLPVLLIIIVISFSVKQIVKTSDVELSQSNSFFYYLAYYVGSPIAVLNSKIDSAFLFSSLLFPTTVKIPTFVYLGSLNYGGNVDTLLGLTLLNQGMIVLVIKLFLLYTLGGFLYYRVRQSDLFTKQNYLMLLILSVFYQIFTMSYYSDSLYVVSDIVTNGLIAVLTFVLFWLFTQRIQYEREDTIE